VIKAILNSVEIKGGLWILKSFYGNIYLWHYNQILFVRSAISLFMLLQGIQRWVGASTVQCNAELLQIQEKVIQDGQGKHLIGYANFVKNSLDVSRHISKSERANTVQGNVGKKTMLKNNLFARIVKQFFINIKRIISEQKIIIFVLVNVKDNIKQKPETKYGDVLFVIRSLKLKKVN